MWPISFLIVTWPIAKRANFWSDLNADVIFFSPKTKFVPLEIHSYFPLLSHPGIGGILQWGFWDQQHWQPCAAIATGDDVHPNEAGLAYQNIYHEFIRTKTILDPVEVQEGGVALFELRGFKGTYEVALVDEAGVDLRIVQPALEVVEDSEFIL